MNPRSAVLANFWLWTGRVVLISMGVEWFLVYTFQNEFIQPSLKLLLEWVQFKAKGPSTLCQNNLTINLEKTFSRDSIN